MTRVAVLGGGPAGMAAAYELTATEALRERYEVTVHLPGHRLGGKGASGRERELCDRILEHGLHIWFGFYDNAFALMQDCYGELGRPADAPLATWDAAFKPCHDIVIYEHWKGRWIARRCIFPPSPLPPGEPRIEDMLERVIGWLVGEWGRIHRVTGCSRRPGTRRSSWPASSSTTSSTWPTTCCASSAACWASRATCCGSTTSRITSTTTSCASGSRTSTSSPPWCAASARTGCSSAAASRSTARSSRPGSPATARWR